jgi:hypothetical protein
MCWARCKDGKPCRKREHKDAGKHGHREHTCHVHKGFSGELLYRDDLPHGGQESKVEGTPSRVNVAESDAQVQALKQRVEQLTKENEATKAQLAERNALAAEKLTIETPEMWTRMPEGSVVEMVALPWGDPVRKQVESDFLASVARTGRYRLHSWEEKLLDLPVQIERVERVQNPGLWRSYALKRQDIVRRERGTARSLERFERTSLYHGTDEDTAPKIAHSGFNRSFCGKNATRYGKGVYFALHAGYSSNFLYAKPNSVGLQRVFVCRVLVGEYCDGSPDLPAPPRRQGYLLYDSTVDKSKRPEIFVTYHDCQAYPEFCITFRRRQTNI